MAEKRKKNQDQPELPIQEAPDNTPGEVHAAPTPANGNGKPPNGVCFPLDPLDQSF